MAITFRRLALSAIAALMLLPTAASAAPACPGATATAEAASLAELRGAVTCLLRHERRELGAGNVRHDQRLARAGTHQAAQMVRRGFFGHVSPAGEKLSDRLGWAKWIPRRGTWDAGEILAWGTGKGATPKAFVAAWMKSPGHFAVLRDPGFTQIGVGLVRGTPKGASSGLTAAVEFGHR